MEQAIRDAARRGLTKRELGEQLGMGQEELRAACRRLGLPKWRHRVHPDSPRARTARYRLEQLHTGVRRGASLSALATVFGVTRQAVFSQLKRSGLWAEWRERRRKK